MDADVNNFVSAEDISVFQRSKPAVNAVKVLGEVDDAKPGYLQLRDQDFVSARDYLLAEISFANANRS